MVSNCNCSNAQNHQNRRKGGNTNLTVPFLFMKTHKSLSIHQLSCRTEGEMGYQCP
jgi:hypothetical protein